MSRFLISMAVCLGLAGPAVAGEWEWDRETISVTSGTNAASAVTATTTRVRGELLEVYIDLGTATNVDVTLSIDPELSTMGDINLYTNDNVDADVVLRPRFDGHDVAGAALTGDDPHSFVVVGDIIKLVCDNFSLTNATVNAVLKYRK